MRGQSHREGDAQQRGDRNSDKDRADDNAADIEDKNGCGADPNQDNGIDDALHDDGPEGGAAADSLPISEVVASDELAEPGRQNVVGEVPDEHIGRQPAEGHGADRPDQDLPAHRPEQ